MTADSANRATEHEWAKGIETGERTFVDSCFGRLAEFRPLATAASHHLALQWLSQGVIHSIGLPPT
jgi:hypothetical protein